MILALVTPSLAAIIAAVGVLGTLIVGIFNANTAAEATKQVQQVHVLVNQRMTDVLNRVAQLTALLEARGEEIPPDPAVDARAKRKHNSRRDDPPA